MTTNEFVNGGTEVDGRVAVAEEHVVRRRGGDRETSRDPVVGRNWSDPAWVKQNPPIAFGTACGTSLRAGMVWSTESYSPSGASAS